MPYITDFFFFGHKSTLFAKHCLCYEIILLTLNGYLLGMNFLGLLFLDLRFPGLHFLDTPQKLVRLSSFSLHHFGVKYGRPSLPKIQEIEMEQRKQTEMG